MYSDQPLRIHKGARHIAWQNLMVLSINAMLDQGVFSLTAMDHYQGVASLDNLPKHFHFMLPNGLKAKVRCGNIQEAKIALRVEAFAETPSSRKSLKRKPVMIAEGILHRLHEKYLEPHGSFSGSRQFTKALEEMVVVPSGYLKEPD